MAHLRPKRHSPTVIKIKSVAGQKIVYGPVIPLVSLPWSPQRAGAVSLERAPGIFPFNGSGSADKVVLSMDEPGVPHRENVLLCFSPPPLLEPSQKSTKAKESPAVGQSADTVSWLFPASVNTPEPTPAHS